METIDVNVQVKDIRESAPCSSLCSSPYSSPLTMDMIDWKPNYVLSKSSLGQIMRSLQNIMNVIPKNVYETTLYSKLKPAVEILINCYTDILKYNNEFEKNVKYYNLIVGLPTNVQINAQEDGYIRMSNAKIGKLISASKQRINFIETRETPQMYVENQNYLQEFNKMKEQLNTLSQKLCDFEDEFIEAIDQAHKAQQKTYPN